MTNNLSPPASAAVLTEAARVGGEKYARIADRLAHRLPVDHPDRGLTPIEIAMGMRADQIRRGDGSTGPITFREIAQYLSKLTGIDLRGESVRRWYRVVDPKISRAPRKPKGPEKIGERVRLADRPDLADKLGLPPIPPATFQAPPVMEVPE